MPYVRGSSSSLIPFGTGKIFEPIFYMLNHSKIQSSSVAFALLLKTVDVGLLIVFLYLSGGLVFTD